MATIGTVSTTADLSFVSQSSIKQHNQTQTVVLHMPPSQKTKCIRCFKEFLSAEVPDFKHRNTLDGRLYRDNQVCAVCLQSLLQNIPAGKENTVTGETPSSLPDSERVSEGDSMIQAPQQDVQEQDGRDIIRIGPEAWVTELNVYQAARQRPGFTNCLLRTNVYACACIVLIFVMTGGFLVAYYASR